jgi:26S proteasome regulatory subunit T5
MASLEDLDDLEQEQQERKKDEDKKKKEEGGDDSKMDVDDEPKKDEDEIDPDVLNAATTDIINRRRLLENDLRVMRQEFQRLTHEKSSMKDKIKDNLEKIENNRSVSFF